MMTAEEPATTQPPAPLDPALAEPLEAPGTLIFHAPPVQISRKRRSRLQSLTRLVVGGIELGLEQLWERLDEWEDKASSPEATPQLTGPAPGHAPEVQPAQLPQRSKTRLESIRLAAIGLAFQTEDRLRLGAAQAGRATRLLEKQTAPLLEPVQRLPVMKPIRRSFNRLVQRGELELASWIKTGEEEEPQSRALVKIAWRDSTEDSIDFLANHPSVQELVETQSSGLANELVEEVRERTVSADTFLESIARNILRKTPRAALPEPPPEVMSKAASLRSPEQSDRKGSH